MHLRICFLYVVVSIGSCHSFDCGTRPGLRLAESLITSKNDTDKYAELGEVPWQVQLWSNTTWVQFICGGSLIDDFHVVTTAHCMFKVEERPDGRKEPVLRRTRQIFVKVGDNYLYRGERYNVSHIILHPGYKPGPPGPHDIAILKLSTRVRFSETVVPVCLPRQASVLTNSVGFLSGWGFTYRDLFLARILRVATIRILDTLEECIEAFPKTNVSSGMLCAQKSLTVPCQGDSGGPLTQYNTCTETWFLVGVVSFGHKDTCEKEEATNSVYTDVTLYSEWIQKVQDGEPCASEFCQRTDECTRHHNRKYCECAQCKERDPCGNSPCELNEICHNRNGVAVCRCKDSFIQSGLSCIDCGTPPGLPLATPHIIRKDEYVDVGAVPWQIQLFLNTSYAQEYFTCEGALIDDFNVLTAAHCLFDKLEDYDGEIEYVPWKSTELFVRVGSRDLGKGEVYNVAKIFVHPRHIPPLVHDIAVLQLSKRVAFSDTVVPVCLPRVAMNLANTKGYLSAWGYNSSDILSVEELRVATIHLGTMEKCKQDFPRYPDFRGTLCALNSLTSPCYGDSGGPLTQYNPFTGQWFVVGIASFGRKNSCRTPEATSSVYTDVTANTDWIRMVLVGDPCASEPCQHGGQCTRQSDKKESYKCLCKRGFSGENCEIGDFHGIFVKRAEWNASPPKGQMNKLTTPVNKIIIIHSVTSNYPKDCGEVVRNIQSYHMYGRQPSFQDTFQDIGYSFLICNGKVFEGRGWKYQGVHTLGHNDGLGICFVGEFSDILPKKESISAAKSLIKFGLELGMINDDYRLYGHRDLRNTLSPGNALYREIQTWDHYAGH